MQHDVVSRIVRVVFGAAPAPVVRDSVRQDRAVAIEGAARDGLRASLHRLEPLLGVLVPEVVRTVGTNRRKGAILPQDE